jgi:hypothetical protein
VKILTFFAVANYACTTYAEPEAFVLPHFPPELTEFEILQPNEKDDISEMVQHLMNQLKEKYTKLTKAAKEKQATLQGHDVQVARDAHPKAYLGTEAALHVFGPDTLLEKNDGNKTLVDILRVSNLWKNPGWYETDVRFSASNPNIQSDLKPDAHGMAVKVYLNEHNSEDLWSLVYRDKEVLKEVVRAQDYIFINHPVFVAGDVASFFGLVKVGTTRDPRIVPYAWNFLFPSFNCSSWRFRDIKAFLEATTKPIKSPLSEDFFSETPYLLNGYPVKFAMMARESLETDSIGAGETNDNFLRHKIQKRLQESDVYYDFRMQVMSPEKAMQDRQRLIESALDAWEEPWFTVGELKIPKTDVDEDLTSKANLERFERMSMNPWHSMLSQRPLGSIGRSRGIIYTLIRELRTYLNETLQTIVPG